MALVADHIPPELIEKYLDRKCGFFVGAGLSMAAGYPGWRGLLDGLIGKAETNHSLTPVKATECRKLAEDTSKFLMLAEEMKDILGVEFKTYLEETFGNDKIQPSKNHNLLVQLERNNFIITTNYDLLIEKAFAGKGDFQTPYKYYEANAVQRELYLRNFFLLKAHGERQSGSRKYCTNGQRLSETFISTAWVSKCTPDNLYNVFCNIHRLFTPRSRVKALAGLY